MSPARAGLLLVNLGTPASPHPEAVRPYLRQFLWDDRVLDVPAWKRWLVLELTILPFRPRRSAEAYAKIWTERGSPLLATGLDLADKVRSLVPDHVEVALAMRYGEPSIPAALDAFRARGVDRIVVLPLYPQYSSAANGSSLAEIFAWAAARWNVPSLHVVPPFWDHPAFLDAWAEVARPVLEQARPEHVFFSFHGLPERHVRKSDDTGRHCLARPDCCASIVEANRNCYRAQCHGTALRLAERLGISEERRTICFQSRLGREPWIRPHTDEVVVERARAGCRRAAILSPGFVTDCLETLEELGMRAAESWTAAGGEELTVVPCLNASDAWARAVLEIATDSTGWLGETRPSLRDDRLAEAGGGRR
jgi:ferrochelatase